MRKIIIVDRNAREDLERLPAMRETPTHSAPVEKLKASLNEAEARRRKTINRWKRKL